MNLKGYKGTFFNKESYNDEFNRRATRKIVKRLKGATMMNLIEKKLKANLIDQVEEKREEGKES